jgi:hypothetical protein
MTARPDAGSDAALDIRVARADDVEISASILEEAATWGASTGRPSWVPGTFTGPEAVGIARLRRDAGSSSLYLVSIGEHRVATFSLLEADPLFWPSAGDEAMYLHRFGVRRSAAGVGRLAVAWSVGETRRRGREYIRLDCLAENPGIRRYYERCGFRAIDEKVIDAIRYVLYEMAVDGWSGAFRRP